MNVSESLLKGVLIFKPRIFSDDRGYFYEKFVEKKYSDYHIPPFVQDNHSRSKQNVLRGLHYQQPNPQGKLISVIRGKVWDVVVDIRRSSKTFGKWFGIYLSDADHVQMYIPPGFAHGFCVLSNEADFYYKCTNYYDSQNEHGILWNDPALNISWPIANPIISKKDMNCSLLSKVPNHVLFD